MKTEEEKFNGWSVDERTAQTYAPIKFRKPIKALFFIPFWILIGTGILKYFTGQSMPAWFTLTCLGFTGVAILLGFAVNLTHRKAPSCSTCGKPMKLVKTVPTQSDCDQHNYIIGPSGHVYGRSATRHGERIDEIRKSWYTCASCKKYVLLDPQVRIPLGENPQAMDQREADYKRLAQQRAEIAATLKAKK